MVKNKSVKINIIQHITIDRLLNNSPLIKIYGKVIIIFNLSYCQLYPINRTGIAEHEKINKNKATSYFNKNSYLYIK